MKMTWVLLLTLGVVSADVGLGYHYKVPQTSYGVPSYQTGGSSTQYAHTHAGQQGYQNAGLQNTGHQTGTSSSGSVYYQTSGIKQVEPNHLHHHQTGFETNYRSSGQYQASDNKYQQYYQVQHQPAQVFKHFYVHAAPEEPEEVKVRTPIVLPPPQKHYKIIFVKAPSEASAPSVIAPVQQQNEEKTIVYVLVKKPDEQPEVVLPKIEQKPPSKPEVYFIKYKNKEDSQAVINNIVKDYNKGQGVSESTFTSGQGNVHFQGHNHGDESFSASSASAGLTGNLVDVNSATSVSSSSGSSSIYDGSITNQGVPHETYGTPNFRST